MRPVSVRFQCFGPYMAEQFVDFEAMEKNGLFLICGETGAGKTTILDAICYALYGRSSGGLRGGLEVMRCALAGSEDDTLVEYVFDSGGKRYKFTRSLKFKTEKNKKSKHLNDYHNCLRLEEDQEIPLVEKEQDRYVTKKAEELIGLTYDQFRQVIILPQGQFERLLVSDSEEKESILVSLFHAERWHRIAEELQRRVAEKDKALKEEHRSMDEKLRQYGCRNLGELEEKTELERQNLETLLQRTQEAERKLDWAKQEKEQALLEDQAFLELKKRETRLADLQKKTPGFAAEEALLADADRAEALRPVYLGYQGALTARQRAVQGVLEAEHTLQQKEQTLAQVREKQRNHDQSRQAVEEDRQRCILLENAREAYAVLEQREKAASDTARQEQVAELSAQRARKNFQTRSVRLEQAIQQQNQAMQAYQTAQEGYLQGIGATLARELVPGAPCPVCGSREHPAPARAGDLHITEQMLDAALQAMNAAGDQVSEAMKKRSDAEKEQSSAEQLLHDLQRRAAVARTAYEEALAQRLEGIRTEDQRARTQNALTKRIRQYETQDQQLQTELTAALGGREGAMGLLEAARNTLQEAEEALGEQEEQWKKALEASGLQTPERYLAADMAPEEKQRRTRLLHQFRAELEAADQAAREQKQALEGRKQPDLAAVSAVLSQAESVHRSCVTGQTLAAKRLEDLLSDGHQLARRLEEYDARRKTVDNDMIFAKRLRGDSGISLQRYVLGVMLTSVTTEANRLLSGVYSGRYRLYRTDDVAGRSRKSGLELEVYDAQTNQRRSVTTLSGGEKFLVALSLAIGLSTVVQAQGGGVRLEAMFIDEGFGSLDREAVGDALEVLQGIRRGTGIVGIISHVEQLTEVIPTRLEITKGKHGSVCNLRG